MAGISNVMSLIDDSGNGFANDVTIGSDYALYGLFKDADKLASHDTKKLLLPATKLTEGCYNMMFRYCTKLNSVTCLATDIGASDCLTDWLKEAGEFVTGQ